MQKQTKILRDFGNTAKGQTSTLRLPLGETYHTLLITYTGMTVDDFGEVRLIVNGDVVDRYRSGRQLQELNEYRGLTTTSGILHYTFERIGLIERRQRELSALGVGTGQLDEGGKAIPTSVVNISSMHIEIDIKSSATAPTLKASAITSAPKISQVLRKTRHFEYYIAQSGDYEIYDLPKGEVIDKIYFKAVKSDNTIARINSLELMTNATIRYQRTKEQNEHLVRNFGVRKVNSNYFVFDPSEQGYGTERLPTAGLSEMRWKLNVETACNLQLAVEYFGRLQQK